MVENCPDCGKEYKNVSLHMCKSNCSEPEINKRQSKIITGLLMGDASVVVSSKSPVLHLKMINKDFLSWVDDEFGWLSNGYTLTQTAKEAAQSNRDSGFSPNAKEENYSDKYTLRTKTTEQLHSWRDWYSSGKKRYPDSLSLSPVTLKMWYVCDGCMESYNKRPHISISCNNESDRVGYLYSLFNGLGVDLTPHESQRSFSIRFSQKDSQKLFNYMGKPPQGFEHKWPQRYRNS